MLPEMHKWSHPLSFGGPELKKISETSNSTFQVEALGGA
jgi:hypothetical protein